MGHEKGPGSITGALVFESGGGPHVLYGHHVNFSVHHLYRA